MKYHLLALALLISLAPLKAQYISDILGDGFEQRTIHKASDTPATLVRTAPHTANSRAILYIHGFNDYFFQRDMANRFRDSLYNFYALDLQRYGRSLRPHQTPFEVDNLSDYFAEIDSAILIMRSEGAAKITLMGHSTGGLITSLYCNDTQSSQRADGLILNSPFLDMNLNWVVEKILVPITSSIGGYIPDLKIFQSRSTAYFESLDKEHQGEWSYDTSLKFKSSPPTTARWIRAIHAGHKQIQTHSDIDVPILLMYSDKDTSASAWTPQHQVSDSVLSVDDIAHYGDKLGDDVTHCQVVDGLHDLVLSNYEAREYVYRTIFSWLNKKGL